MKYMGIDYGAKNVGLAISDESAEFALPYSVLSNDNFLIQNISSVVKENNVELIVVGDTLTMSGHDNEIGDSVRMFKESLGKSLSDVVVKFVSEYFSSVESVRFTKQKKNDAGAAAIILQRYLDSVRGNNK